MAAKLGALTLGQILAINKPRLLNRFGAFAFEQSTNAARLQAYLEKSQDTTNGLELRITPEGLEGAADPLREGIAIGN